MLRSMRCARAALGILAPLAIAARGTADPIRVDVSATQNNFDTPVWVTLDAGSYSVTPLGIAGGGTFDTWNPWGTADCELPAGCTQTLPTTVTGWKNSYDVISGVLSDVQIASTPQSPIAPEPTGDPALQDYWYAPATPPEIDRYHVDDGLVYPTAADGVATAAASQFTVTAAGPVGFAIRDSYLLDNLGGVSLVITPLPEPGSALGLAVGCAALALRRRRRSR